MKMSSTAERKMSGVHCKRANSAGGEHLFVDLVFPPEKTSLTYVYSGEDKYDQMVFVRAKDLLASPVFAGAGGVCDIRLPDPTLSDKNRTSFAMAIVSLNPKFMERLIPGINKFHQNFSEKYSGSFRFSLWRFGRWEDVVVDDYLPTLRGKLPFCSTLGSPPELWPPLLEKAYAKCHRAYEALESRTLADILTDLTGCVCEHIQVTPKSQEGLFSILYHSCTNRSFICCWRNNKSLNGTEFMVNDRSCTNPMSEGRVFIITAVTKFPLRDGQMLEVIRIKCPYYKDPPWKGDFSRSREQSWNSVHPAYMDNHRPRECLSHGEFWIPVLSFTRHFDDVIICSSSDNAFRSPDYHSDERRYYSSMNDSTFTNLSRMIGRDTSICTPDNETDNSVKQRTKSIVSDVQDSPILIQSLKQTKEIDNRFFIRRRASSGLNETQDFYVNMNNLRSQGRLTGKTRVNCYAEELDDVQEITCVSRDCDVTESAPGIRDELNHVSDSPIVNSARKRIYNQTSRRPVSGASAHPGLPRQHSDTTSRMSISSDSSANVHSTSQVRLSFAQNRNLNARRQSAPQSRHASLGSISTTVLFEAGGGQFRPNGAWKEVINLRSKWKRTKKNSLSTPYLSNNRIPLMVSGPDPPSSFSATSTTTCHVLVSLIQDDRREGHVTTTFSSKLGLYIYRAKNVDRDEKRSLSKLPVVSNMTSQSMRRELNGRLDLDPGAYFLVPYVASGNQDGEFLLRVLMGKHQVTAKNGCSIS